MEDSYTVHRRRKAAARRREKTPEPSTRSQRLLDASEDEEEATRARMEKMAEDTERLEKEKQPGESRNEERAVEEAKSLDGKRKKEERQVELGKSVVRAIELRGEISRSEESMMDARSAEAASVAADDASRMRDVVGNDENEREETKRKMAVERSPRSIRKAAEATDRPEEESRREMLEIRETLERSAKVRLEDGGKEVGTRVMAATAASVVAATASATTEEERHAKEAPDARKIDRRTKKKSKDRGGGLERLERQSRSTDSSDERSETASPRRTKSSDTSARTRTMRKSASSGVSSRSRSSGNAETAREKRSVQRRDEDAEDRLGVSESARDDESDRGTMTKSQSFPHRSLGLATGMKRSTSDVRKQVIPLSNESLLEDFAKAQRDYLARERGILDPEPTGESLDECVDVFQDAREEVTLRKRKHGEIPASSERQEMTKTAKTGVDDDNSTDARWWKAFSFLGWLLSAMRRSKETKIESDADYRKDVDDEFSVRRLRAAVGASAEQKVSLLDFFRTLRNFVAELKAFTAQNPRETRIIRCLRNRCIAELILVVIYCGLGAFVFRFTEGAFEAFYKCGVKRVKRDFLDSLWNYSHNLREDDWKSVARRKLMEFEEQLHTAHEAGVHTYSGQRSWSFMNAIVYCLTVITTIGEDYVGLGNFLDAIESPIDRYHP